jgi:hypothetical protein
LAIFAPPAPVIEIPLTDQPVESAPINSNSASKNTNEAPVNGQTETITATEIAEIPHVLSADEAIGDVSAIPLYFPTSYSLVKPYIQGFEINTLDAPSLKEVKIDNNWQPKKPEGES